MVERRWKQKKSEIKTEEIGWGLDGEHKGSKRNKGQSRKRSSTLGNEKGSTRQIRDF